MVQDVVAHFLAYLFPVVVNFDLFQHEEQGVQEDKSVTAYIEPDPLVFVQLASYLVTMEWGHTRACVSVDVVEEFGPNEPQTSGNN